MPSPRLRNSSPLTQTLKELEDRQETRIELGLSRVLKVLGRLGNPHLGLPCIHVAGTNGKGSVCAILEAVLREAGYKTGFYHSPHLFDVRERIRNNGRWISKASFARLMSRVLEADKGKNLTYFELLTLVAFLHFREKKVDVAILETGLGGRLDATNVIENPLAAVISSIDFDHTQFLGNTLEEISAEKAGIIKPGCPVLCSVLAESALKVVRDRAHKLSAPLTVVGKPHKALSVNWRSGRQVFEDSRGLRYTLGLLGSHQGFNAALARATLDQLHSILPVCDLVWRSGTANVSWPGRFEARHLGLKTVILDGAHNLEAMRQLARTWDKSPWANEKCLWILGLMRDKDVSGVLREISGRLRDVVVVRPPSPRAMEPLSLARQVRRRVPSAHVSVERDPGTAIKDWLGRRGSPRVAVICGSFYLVGEAYKHLRGGGSGPKP